MTPLPSYLIAVGAMLIATSAMLFFYKLALQGHTSFRFMRNYLLSIPLVGILCMVFCLTMHYIPLPPKGEVVIHQSKESNTSPSQTETTLKKFNKNAAEFTPKQEKSITVTNSRSQYLQMAINGLPWGITLVSVLLLCIVWWQLIHIRRKMRGMKFHTSDDGIRVVQSAWVKTPFSFGRTIFMPENKSAQYNHIILLHEKAHIQCLHYRDVWMIESICCLLWFNPIVWMTRKTLRNLHEFEADRCVLQQGIDISTYQTLLLEEVMGNSSSLANGFNHSFIRRRFIEMKRTDKVLVKRPQRIIAVVLPSLMLGAITTYAWQKNAPLTLRYIYDSKEIHTSGENPSKNETTKIAGDSCHILASSGVIESSDTLCFAEQDTKTEPCEGVDTCYDIFPIEQQAERPTHAEDGWPILYSLPLSERQGVNGMYIENIDGETHLTFIRHETQPLSFYRFGGPDAYLVDPSTGVHYQARRSIPAEAWNHFHLYGMQGKTWKVTVVFPPLPESVQQIALYAVTHHLENDKIIDIEQIRKK